MTIGPASRVPLAFVSVLAGVAPDPRDRGTRLDGELAGQAAALAAALAASGAPAVPAGLLVRAVIAWTQLFGMVSWELFGHAVAQMAAFVGLA